MNQTQQQVLEFHKAFQIEHHDTPQLPENMGLRESLIREELDELQVAFDHGDLVAVADAIGDLLYVVYGTAVACGLDMEPIMNEIHRSNMSKVGGTKNAYGKLIKPPHYSPASLEPIIEQQTRVWTPTLSQVNCCGEGPA